MAVHVAGIWNEGRASYPGRSVALPSGLDVLPASRGVGPLTSSGGGAAEVSRGHSRAVAPAAEGPNVKCRKEAPVLDDF